MLQQTNIEIIDQLVDLLKNINLKVYKEALQPLHLSKVGQPLDILPNFIYAL